MKNNQLRIGEGRLIYFSESKIMIYLINYIPLHPQTKSGNLD